MDPKDFDAAFADAIVEPKPTTAVSTIAVEAALKAPAVPENTPATPAAQAAQAAETPAVAATQAQGEPTEIEMPVEGETPAIQAAVEHPPEPVKGDDEMLRRFAALMAAAQPQQAQQQTQAQSQQPMPPPVYSNEDVAALRQFYTEWPDVAKAAEIMARGMVTNAMRSMYADIAANLAPHIQTINALADQAQLGELQAKVPDYGQVVDQLSGWVDKQPDYLKPAYQRVIEQGTSAEVIDLIDRFKRETGSMVQATQQPSGGGAAQVQTQQRPATELSPAAKQAAARLAPISSKRSNATTAAPTDFDSAFSEFAKTA